MKISDLKEKLQLKTFGNADADKDILGGYASDLLSDVMGNANEGDVWITMQTHKNIVAVASLKDIAAIIISNGSLPDDDTIEAANTEGISLLGSDFGTFKLCGEIYNIMEN
ncbi:serine kinase [Bacteroidales bacterium OttesenSCG-928-L14]|nr:serine kinase [Bacteroidales bacterium OttesenSCG-928-L14]